MEPEAIAPFQTRFVTMIRPMPPSIMASPTRTYSEMRLQTRQPGARRRGVAVIRPSYPNPDNNRESDLYSYKNEWPMKELQEHEHYNKENETAYDQKYSKPEEGLDREGIISHLFNKPLDQELFPLPPPTLHNLVTSVTTTAYRFNPTPWIGFAAILLGLILVGWTILVRRWRSKTRRRRGTRQSLTSHNPEWTANSERENGWEFADVVG